MEALNEQQYPLVKLVLEQALEPELVRVQALRVQALRVQALVQVQLEPLVQTQPQVQLELEQRLQRSHSKPQLHPHHCKEPDHNQEPQLELRQAQVHPKALDMTPRVLVLALELQEIVQQKLLLKPAWAPELEQVQGLAAQLAQELEQPVQQELLAQELELEPEPHVFLERLPLQQG